MTAGSIQFEKLRIDRVGDRIRRGEGFELTDLSPGITLIHGPNASGKSTTALVIQELLWPGRVGLARPTLEGWFRENESRWHVDIDAGHVVSTRDGRPGTALDIGPVENRLRYHLALDELIVDDNSEFAAKIAHASQGGYDLAAAEEKLGFRSRPRSPRGAVQELQRFRDEVERARRRQMEIEQEAAHLETLRRDRKTAIEAHEELARLEKVRDYCLADEACGAIESKLGTIPEGVSRLRGDERARLDRIDEQMQANENHRDREEERIRRAATMLAETRLPESGIDPAVFRDVRSRVDRLKSVETELRGIEEKLEEAQVRERKAWQRLDGHIDRERLEGVDRVEIGELSPFARRVQHDRAEREVLDERRRRLEQSGPDEEGSLHDRDAITRGIALLSNWLASPEPAPASSGRVHWPIAAAAGAIVFLATVLAGVHHGAWILAALFGPLVFGADWWVRRRPAAERGTGARRVYQQDYESTDLPPPDSWQENAVADLLGRLVRLAHASEQEAERQRRLGELEVDGQSLAGREDELEAERARLADRLGIAIRVADEWLPLLVDNISAWQRSHDDVAVKTGQHKRITEERNTLLESINTAIGPHGYDRVDSAEAAAEAVRDLEARQKDYETASRERTEARRQLDESVAPELKRLASERRAILERLGLDDERAHQLDAWLKQRPEYEKLTGELAEKKAVRENQRRALAGHEHLLKMDRETLERKIQEQRDLAETRDNLTERIAGIERDIENAKRGNDLSDALRARDAAEANLARARDGNQRAVAGSVLTDWVREEAVERSRPEVFQRANELLARFTLGSLELTLDDRDDPPVFKARAGTEPARPVEHLSIGERVQTLMAVRLAFLERDERVRLPLLLDEALGTSDDARTDLIIDSVIAVAREGRQVFYFTAQHHEIAKWETRLARADVPHAVIDLAQVRRLSTAKNRPLETIAVESPEPIAPDGMDYEDYGHALGVPNLDPSSESIDQVHLWHLLDDAQALHRLLRLRIVTWFQLRTLMCQGGHGLVPEGDGIPHRASAAARAVEEACRLWRIGRGKPVDRAVLEDSGCVSETFINEVSALAATLNGDAAALIQELEAGRVSRWRKSNTEGLRAYFEENGYLANAVPLPPEELRVRVLAAVADDLAAERLNPEHVERILASLHGHAGVQPD